MVKRKGFPQVGAAAVRYHKGIEVFSKKMGMGGRAEVYCYKTLFLYDTDRQLDTRRHFHLPKT